MELAGDDPAEHDKEAEGEAEEEGIGEAPEGFTQRRNDRNG